MDNILSYINNPTFSGQEIIDWVNYQIKNHTSHEKMAHWIDKKFHNLNPKAKYQFYKGEERTGVKTSYMIRKEKT